MWQGQKLELVPGPEGQVDLLPAVWPRELCDWISTTLGHLFLSTMKIIVLASWGGYNTDEFTYVGQLEQLCWWPYNKPAVPNLFDTRDRLSGERFSHWRRGGEGTAHAWFTIGGQTDEGEPGGPASDGEWL